MGQEREIINSEFKDMDEIDTEESVNITLKNKNRKRNELKYKDKKNSNMG